MSAPTDARHHTAADAPDRVPGVRADLVGGARAMAPWLLGVVPFGLVIGVSASHAGVPALARWLTGPPLDMVLPLFLPGEVVHPLRDRSTTVAALAAGGVAAIATSTPQHLGPILALGAGITAGLLTERSTS